MSHCFTDKRRTTGNKTRGFFTAFYYYLDNRNFNNKLVKKLSKLNYVKYPTQNTTKFTKYKNGTYFHSRQLVVFTSQEYSETWDGSNPVNTFVKYHSYF